MKSGDLQNGDEFVKEIKKFVGKEVEVFPKVGKSVSGVCKAVSYNHLNVVLMTDKEKIVVKDIKFIRRERSYQNG